MATNYNPFNRVIAKGGAIERALIANGDTAISDEQTLGKAGSAKLVLLKGRDALYVFGDGDAEASRLSFLDETPDHK